MYHCRECQAEIFPTPNQVKHANLVCSSCRSAYEKAWRRRRNEEGRHVVSGKMPREYHRAYDRVYFLDESNRQRRNALMRKYTKDPTLRVRHIARWKVTRAVKSGRLVKQPCEVCGLTAVQAHHDDYSKPLDVRWLCITHHAKAEGGKS